MKEITLKIPTKKLPFFLELIKQLNFEIKEKVDLNDEIDASEIPQKQKDEVLKRISTSNPQQMVSWKEARKDFTFKSKD